MGRLNLGAAGILAVAGISILLGVLLPWWLGILLAILVFVGAAAKMRKTTSV